MIKIFPCGTEVILERTGNFGNITAVEIRFELIRYEVTYYIDGYQQKIWVHPDELHKENKRKTGIGFK